MKVTTSYGCQQCDEIIPNCPKGVCPICGSGAVYPLVTRGVEEERKWQNRIGKSRSPSENPCIAPKRSIHRLTHNMALRLTDWRKDD